MVGLIMYHIIEFLSRSYRRRPISQPAAYLYIPFTTYLALVPIVFDHGMCIRNSGLLFGITWVPLSHCFHSFQVYLLPQFIL